MAKVRIRTGRGTGTIEVDNDPSKWTGAQFRKIQESRKNAAKNTMVHTGRGTSSKRLGDMPDPASKPVTKGMTRITGRGTSTRKSRGRN